jgi:hypothetical protein
MGAVLLAALLAARLDAAVETGGHVGSQTAGARDLAELQPSLTGILEQPALRLQGRYAPRFLWSADRHLGLRHEGLFAGNWQQSRNLQWTASENFRYGRNDFIQDAGATRPFDFVETLVPVIADDLSTDTELGFGLVASRTVGLSASVGYLTYGGRSAASQRVLPFQHGPQLWFGLDQDLTRNDRLSTEMYASQSFASGNRQNSLLKLSESWQSQLGPTTRGKLSVGASAWRKWRPVEGASAGWFPVASAALERDVLQRRQRFDFKVLASVGPHMNPLTAELLERAELGVSARWIRQDKLSIRGRAAAARELAASGSRLAQGTLDVSYQPKPEISISVGAGAFWQQVPSLPDAPNLRWLAFTSLTFGARNLM